MRVLGHVCCNQRLGTRTLWHGAFSSVNVHKVRFPHYQTLDVHAAYPEVHPDNTRKMNKSSPEGTTLIDLERMRFVPRQTSLDPEQSKCFRHTRGRRANTNNKHNRQFITSQHTVSCASASPAVGVQAVHLCTSLDTDECACVLCVV